MEEYMLIKIVTSVIYKVNNYSYLNKAQTVIASVIMEDAWTFAELFYFRIQTKINLFCHFWFQRKKFNFCLKKFFCPYLKYFEN